MNLIYLNCVKMQMSVIIFLLFRLKLKQRYALNNEHYTGIAHYEDGTYNNIYPKIIDKSIFEACRTKNQINNRRPRHFINNYILSGKLYCME